MNRINYLAALSLLVCFMSSCSNDPVSLFTSLSSEQTHVTFNNIIEDSEELSILNYEYIYNGGGVGIADFNNDGLQDIVFTGNAVDNSLYMNTGNLMFKDVSSASGIDKHSRWSTGVAIVDVNLDGWLDMYITSSGHDQIQDKSNLLFINQGLNTDGIPTFKEMASLYGIENPSNDTNAAFFDYDNDNDLDLFIISNQMPPDNQPSRYREKVKDGSSRTVDHLYQNNWSEAKGHPEFSEVGKAAGILVEGFSLGLNVCDLNQDGWKDVYITNDYLSNDLLYINNQDGTFSDRSADYFKHTSFSAMGNDVADLDNDGDADIVVVDMLPKDNYRRKTMMPPNKYVDYINNERFDYQYQFMRNTLQENLQNSLTADAPTFSEVAHAAQISATDWSWTPLVADFDNDGLKDLIVTNGFPKDITDRDFIDYSVDVGNYASDSHLLPKIPSVKIKNYAFRNHGELNFEDVTTEWGIDEPSFSNGAAFGDLDNDGDLDYVVNNINGEASIYQNQSLNANSIRIKLIGPKQNPLGIGAVAMLYYDSLSVQYIDFTTSRGYLSAHEPIIHFGLPESAVVDSLIVHWPDKNVSKLDELSYTGLLECTYSDSKPVAPRQSANTVNPTLYSITDSLGIQFEHEEIDFIDYNVQAMLPHKLSQYGPALAVGDVNDDGLDDLFLSGSHFHKGQIFMQTSSGKFQRSERILYKDEDDYESEELGALLFDADADGDNDLYVIHGGYEVDASQSQYQDRLYINQNGQFTNQPNALPNVSFSGLSVKAADYDQDGDLDLFVGGRVIPHKYPESPGSVLLRNDSEAGNITFTNVTETLAPSLTSTGMITDMLWSDFNNDGRVDMILVGEFISMTLLENTTTGFKDVTKSTGIQNKVGWWNSIVGGDFDQDGDIDYVLGNIGHNTSVQVSEEYPYKVYYSDFDSNGVKDVIPACHFLDRQGEMEEFPYFGRLEIVKQVNPIRKWYRKHHDIAVVSMPNLFNRDQMKESLILSANTFSSSYIENLGDGRLAMRELPQIVQKAPVYGMATTDLNQDGYLDILMVGNDFGMEVSLGRMDAHNGIVGLGNGDGSFEFSGGESSGFLVPDDGKAIVKIYNAKSKRMDYLVSQNQSKLLAFSSGTHDTYLPLLPSDSYAIVTLKNGNQYKTEFHYGDSFLGQSSRYIRIPRELETIDIYNFVNEKRSLQ